jgi:hypothetical protein
MRYADTTLSLRASHVRALVRKQEQGQLGHFLGRAHVLHWHHLHAAPVLFRATSPYRSARDVESIRKRGGPMLSVIARAQAFALPWLAAIAISLAIVYGMSAALASGASMTTPGDASVRIATARPLGGAAAGGEGRVIYAGNNCWIPDPSGSETCGSQTGSGR